MPLTRTKHTLPNKIGWIGYAFYVALILVSAEFFLRMAIFSESFKISKLREPSLYADYLNEDDYWKLYHRFGGPCNPPPPAVIHPLLGWTATPITPKNPLGLKNKTVERLHSSKTRLLFYGDSFVQGLSDPEYLICNYLSDRLDNTVVADMSCQGYGLDQIYLTFVLTRKEAGNSPLLIGVLGNDDLDRSILTVRVGQKMRFQVKNHSLVPTGLPIDRNPEEFFKKNPPRIKSYFLRLILRGWLGTKETRKDIAKKKKVNNLILEKIKEQCDSANQPLLFVLFYPRTDLGRISWQEVFLKNKCSELGIPFIDTKPLLTQYAKENQIDLDGLYIMENGHHNNLGNKIISEGILRELKSMAAQNSSVANL